MITEEQLDSLYHGDPVRYGIFKNLKFDRTEDSHVLLIRANGMLLMVPKQNFLELGEIL